MNTTQTLTTKKLADLIHNGFNILAVTTRYGARYEYKLIDGVWCLFGQPKNSDFVCRHANMTGRWAAWGPARA